MKGQLWLFLFLLAGERVSAQMPACSSGRIERIPDFPSRYVTPRNIDVWLPDGFESGKDYGVLYMHDGQMLFDSAITWNRQSWDMDETGASLQNSAGKFIVVGIWNSGSGRHADYFPQKPFEAMSQTEKDSLNAQLQRAGRTNAVFSPVSDMYLKFIAEELKPAIEKRYGVRSDRKHTWIAGSSMGGLISLYAICEYPDVFGGAACLSTHWPGSFTLENNPFPHAFRKYLSRKLPGPRHHRIYFDLGDQTLDAMYPPLQAQIDELVHQAGYRKNWRTLYLPGEDHSEKSWRKRMPAALEFLTDQSLFRIFCRWQK
jgi:predicted alpha/beta superfamily hydrolase